MPNQAQVELFKQVFDGYQTGIDPNDYDAERRTILVEQGHSGFWLKHYNDDKPCGVAEIYEAGQQIGSLLFTKAQWDRDDAFVVLRTGGLKVETSAAHAVRVIEGVIKRVALQNNK